MVSIIIPCYNAQQTLREAIESALSQTLAEKEIIVIDDGSSDQSFEIIRSFGDRIRYETGPNRGAPAARNRGLELARGDRIQFLDADDILYPDKLSIQDALLEDSGADMVFCNGERESEGNTAPRALYKSPPNLSDPLLFALREQIPILAPLHRREALVAAGGFRLPLPCAQERDLHIRLACASATWTYHPDVLFRIRRQSESLSANYLSVLDQHLDIARHASGILRASGRLTDPRSRALAEFLARDARHYFQRGRPEQGYAYLRGARSMHPEGGLSVYGPAARIMLRLLGPRLTEQLSGFRRRSVKRPSPA